MSLREVDLLGVDQGTVVAPAGHGKTYSIAAALVRYRGDFPVLVLTHTNAGVGALETKLHALEVPRSRYKLYTLDAFCCRLVRQFPIRSAAPPPLVDPATSPVDYAAMRACARQLLSAGHLDRLLRTTYARLIVDEYQDCCEAQHAIVSALAAVLPCCVLGDPLQAIFGIGGTQLPPWEDVLTRFPLAAELTHPHRWERAGAPELGDWLADVRRQLLHGTAISLAGAPKSVEWVPLYAADDFQGQMRAANRRLSGGDGSALVVADSVRRVGHGTIAKGCRGSVIENAELSDLHKFVTYWDADPASRGERTLELLGAVLVGFNATTLATRTETVRRGKARKPATELEAAALRFLDAPGPDEMGRFLKVVRRTAGVWVCRPTALHALETSVTTCCRAGSQTLGPPFAAVRDGLRRTDRTRGGKRVGSTLLVKGLEADLAIVLNPTVMDARHLYVALTRGARHLTICSPTDELRPC